MPKVWIKDNPKPIDAMMLRSLLFTLQINDIRIIPFCGGNALCGKCAIRIIKGRKHLSPKSKKEEEMLAKMDAAEDIRLACQAHPGKEIEIEILNNKVQK